MRVESRCPAHEPSSSAARPALESASECLDLRSTRAWCRAGTLVKVVFMSTWPPRFLFLSGRLCLDLAHTGGEGQYAKFERLHGPPDLADWLMACELAVPVARVRRPDLRIALELRAAIWKGARAILKGAAMPRAFVDTIGSVAAQPDLVPVLVRGTRRWSPGSTARQALSSVARDAIALFGSDERKRLRECRNPKCPLLFVDLSRPGRRAWCTMRRCGNLEKTTRYRRRRRASRSSASPE